MVVEVLQSKKFRFIDAFETQLQLAERIKGAIMTSENVSHKIQLLANGEVAVTLFGNNMSQSDFEEDVLTQKNEFISKLREDFLDIDDAISFETFVVGNLIRQNQSITAAESLTAGEFQSTIGNVSGVSAIFPGGFVTYANKTKHQLLGIPEEIISKYGVVSQQVAMAMAANSKRILSTDLAISFTGVAGPDKLEGQAAGTVWIGLAFVNQRTEAWEMHFSGERAAVRKQSVYAGLDIIRRQIIK